LYESEQPISWFNGSVFWLKASSQMVLLQIVLVEIEQSLSCLIAVCFGWKGSQLADCNYFLFKCTPTRENPTRIFYSPTFCLSLWNKEKFLYDANARKSETVWLNTYKYAVRFEVHRMLSTQLVVFGTVTLCRLGAGHQHFIGIYHHLQLHCSPEIFVYTVSQFRHVESEMSVTFWVVLHVWLTFRKVPSLGLVHNDIHWV